MGKTSFLVHLFVVGLFAQLTLCNNNKHRSQLLNNIFNNEISESQNIQQHPMMFLPGKEFIFEYNGQIASGLFVIKNEQKNTYNNYEYDNENSNKQQNAVLRVQSKVKITFDIKNSAILRLEQTRFGQLNHGIKDPKHLQPVHMFEKKTLDEQTLYELEKPCKFRYVDGIVENIYFHPTDKPWSKNIKRAVLNMIQVNLNRKNIEYQDNEFIEEQDEINKAFIIPEISIEGDCMTTYSINTNKQNNEWELLKHKKQKQLNVTKSINFKKCKHIADVTYGFHNQDDQNIKCVQQIDESCDPKKVNEKKLDRSTVQRFEIIEMPGKHFAIKRVETLSQYTLKNIDIEIEKPISSAMRTIAVAELVFRGLNQLKNLNKISLHNLKQLNFDNSKTETLLYNNEWDVENKRFFMYGDAIFNGENFSYSNLHQKVEQSVNFYRILLEAINEKTKVAETETVALLQSLVNILQMSSVKELEKIYKSVQKLSRSHLEIDKVQQLIADTLAISGTHNTIYVLIKMIENSQLTPVQAAQTIKKLHGMPAPSETITDMIINLAKNEIVYRSPLLKQTVWLSFGTIVGELCRKKISAQSLKIEKNWNEYDIHLQESIVFGAQSEFKKTEICSQEKKELYKQILLQQYKDAETIYEKILALKAIGNAGFDNIVNDLEHIINKKNNQSDLVRIVAISALRRLRKQMPRKIQLIVLPIFQNIRENPIVRIAALTSLINTQPEQQIIDQIIYTLSKENSTEVQSFTYNIIKSLSESQISEDQEIAKHMKIALQLANVNEQKIKNANNWQIPLYSNKRQEGFLFKVFSIQSFSDDQMFPTHIAASLDTLFNGKWQNDMAKISMTQQGANKWIENIIQILNLNQQKNRLRSTKTYSEHLERELKNIVSNLQIKSRLEEQEQEKQNYQNNEPFLMANIRLGDIDHAIIPISTHNLPKFFKTFIANFISFFDQPHIRWLNAFIFNEKSAKIPTSIGLPLFIHQSTPMLTSGEINVKQESKSNSLEIKAHVMTTLIHMQKMKIWTPIFSTGVEKIHGVEINAPLDFEIKAKNNKELENNLSLVLKLPQGQKTRLIGAHTMTTTFVQQDQKKNLRTIYDLALENTYTNVIVLNETFSKHIPLCINGHFHMPNKWNDLTQLIQILLATENHIHIDLEPKTKMTNEIVFQIQASFFQKNSIQSASELNNFYSDAEMQFFPIYPEDQKNMELDNNVQNRQKLAKVLERLEKQKEQMYKHDLKFSVETNGEKKIKAEIKLQAICDSTLLYCKMINEIKRSPFFPEETSWTLKQKIEVLIPESVSSIHEMELFNNQKNQKLFFQINNEWGTEEHNQFINLRIHGENALTKQQRQIGKSNGQHLQKQNSLFINKYNVVANYKLQKYLKNTFQDIFEILKFYNYFNTESRIEQTGRDNQLFATLIIDPTTQRQISLSIRTPTQVIRIINIQMPISLLLMPLVRASQKPVHSFIHILSRFTPEKRNECIVSDNFIETFDKFIYKIPITQCFSVLAKDCHNIEHPRFIVLMKSLTEDKQQKKIKIITSTKVIECEPKQGKNETWKGQKITCSINGHEITAQQQKTAISSNMEQDYQTIEYNNDEQTSVVINVNEISVRFGCKCTYCKCQKAWIKISDEYKNNQCGLCGHYDNNISNELRMNNSKLTDDLVEFHRSYTLTDDNECTEIKRDNFYSNNKQKFRFLNNQNNFQHESSKQNYKNNEINEQNIGVYLQEDESDKEWNRLQFKNDQTSEETKEPIMTTKIIELNNRICFSKIPIKQCPSGFMNSDKIENLVKYEFACLLRFSSKTRRLQHEVRQNKIIDLKKYESNFIHFVSEPTQCVHAY